MCVIAFVCLGKWYFVSLKCRMDGVIEVCRFGVEGQKGTRREKKPLQ